MTGPPYHPQVPPYPPSPYQAPPQPSRYHATVAQGGLPAPVAVEAVPGTPFAVAVVGVAPTTSGPATASLVAGVGSVLVSFVVGCFAAVGAQPGWGAMVAGAFAVLAALVAAGAIGLGQVGLRHTSPRRTDAAGREPVRGRGMAVTGIICGVVGLVLTGLAMLLAFTL